MAAPDSLKNGTCPVTPPQPVSGGCPAAAAFDPFQDPYLADPPGSLRWSRDEQPVFYSEKLGYWVVTRYADVKAVFRDNETFSPSIALEKITPLSPEAVETLKKYDYAMNRTLVNEDEPAHMPRRRVLQDPFSAVELRHHEAMVRGLAREHVDRMVGKGRADLVAEMLYEIPLTVALHFLGIPEEDMDTLREYSVSHTLNTWGRPRPEEQVAIAESVGKFWRYAGQVLEKLRRDPSGHGWMPYSIRRQQEVPDVITDSYLHSMMMAGLVAAHETTAHAAANAIRLLLENRASWEALCADPGLIPGAVDECLRHTGSVAAWRRLVTRDTEIDGVPIPCGAKLLIVGSSANHDERHFEDPDTLDILRDNADDHLTFGYGAHRCLGKNLARMELQIILQELTARLPHLELAPGQRFTYLPNTSFRGPEQLWVQWDPQRNPERADPGILGRTIPVSIGKRPRAWRTVVVESVEAVAGGVLRFTLVDRSGVPLPAWSPGAHIDVQCGDLSRQYSLCGRPGGPYQIAVRLEDDGRGGSRYLHTRVRPGQTLAIKGPRNHFRLEPGADHYVLVAGGIGITPIVAMADRLRAEGSSYEIHYAGRGLGAMAMLDRLADHQDRLTLYPAAAGHRLDVPGLLAKPRPGTQVYACGPKRLIDALEVATEGWPEGSLHVEHFAAAAGTLLDPDREHAFDVELRDSARTVRVRADQTVLQALRECGIAVDSDCEEGICGSCEVAVLDGDVDHRDRVLIATERAANTRMMACCSRARGRAISLGL